MRARRWIIAALVAITGGWMLFDGIHAFVTGDFVTPSSGEYAGQLGPWAAIPGALGIDPRSFGIKLFFVIFGAIDLVALALFLADVRGSRALLLGCAAVALLYIPFGTITSVLVIVLLSGASVRAASRRDR